MRARRFFWYPTAIGWHPSEKAQYGAAQLDAWRTIQRSHAIANGIYVAAVNRVGYEGPPDHGLEFWGSSFVADPFGQVIAQGSCDQEEILIAECDPRRMEEVRRNWPFLRDRRIDAYAPILSDGSTNSRRLHSLGFRMPAEWEPHEATWLAWPHEKSDWPGKFAPIPWLYGEIVRHLARVERVRILVQDPDAEQAARRILKKCHADLDAVEFFHHPTNRSWTRDYCPLFVKNGAGEVAITHWRFNGWAKYDNSREDARTPAFIARTLKVPRKETGLVLEGGSIDVNGAGKLLTTEECLLSPVQARNPGAGPRDRTRVSRLISGIRK